MPDITSKEKQKLVILTSLLDREITNGEAAKKLGLSIRQIQRLNLRLKNMEFWPSSTSLRVNGKVKTVKLQRWCLFENIRFKFSFVCPEFIEGVANSFLVLSKLIKILWIQP